MNSDNSQNAIREVWGSHSLAEEGLSPVTLAANVAKV